MSWFADAFKAVATVATDVTAKAARVAVAGAAEVAGVFDEQAKHDIHRAGLQAEQAIRRNPVIDAINEIDNHERGTTKELIRYIDTTMDTEHECKLSGDTSPESLHKWSVRAYLCYLFHEMHSKGINPMNCAKEQTVDMCKEYSTETGVDFNQIADELNEFLDWDMLFSDKDCYLVARKDVCILGFCGTKFSDFNHLLADITVGNLVAGYHYKMADIACMYWDMLKDMITKYDTVRITGHSLGAGIAMYMNILLSIKSPNTTVVSYGFGAPCVLPRVLKNRMSHRIVNTIDNCDPVSKYYKNDAVAHANKLVHIDRNNVRYRRDQGFQINWNRFSPLNQIAKLKWDCDQIEAHYMKSYINVLHAQRFKGFDSECSANTYDY